MCMNMGMGMGMGMETKTNISSSDTYNLYSTHSSTVYSSVENNTELNREHDSLCLPVSLSLLWPIEGLHFSSGQPFFCSTCETRKQSMLLSLISSIAKHQTLREGRGKEW